jgi:phage baseplate assembly protein W
MVSIVGSTITNLSSAIYTDLNSLVGVVSDPILITDEKAILNSIYNIITTPIGTRYRYPDYGSVVLFLINDPADDITAFKIESGLVQAVQRWEPRAQIIREQTKVTADPIGNSFSVVITFYMPRFDKVNSLSMTIRKP